jgi:transposase
MNAIGIDMSKDSFHAAFDEQEVLKFVNSKEGINEFLEKLKTKNIKLKDFTIGVEATGIYHLLFCTQLSKIKLEVVVINPLESHRMITSTLRAVKTDRHDALAIRKMVLLGSGYLFTDTPSVLALKALVSEREALVQLQTMTKQRKHVHSIRENSIDMPIYDSFYNLTVVLKQEIQNIEKRMQTYSIKTQSLLKTIPGVGKVTAVTLIAFIGDIKRFSSPEKLVAYIGLDCRVYQSGTSIKGKGYISKRGNAYLRHILFNAALVARLHNPTLKRYFIKKTNEGKHYFSAMCAVERKLVHIIWAVWKRGTSYEERP